jgi:hypothetical protein
MVPCLIQTSLSKLVSFKVWPMEQSRQYQDTDIVRTLGLESRDRDRKRLKRWGIIAIRNVSMILRHFFREITVEAFPPPVAPACVLLGRQAY